MNQFYIEYYAVGRVSLNLVIGLKIAPFATLNQSPKEKQKKWDWFTSIFPRSLISPSPPPKKKQQQQLHQTTQPKYQYSYACGKGRSTSTRSQFSNTGNFNGSKYPSFRTIKFNQANKVEEDNGINAYPSFSKTVCKVHFAVKLEAKRLLLSSLFLILLLSGQRWIDNCCRKKTQMWVQISTYLCKNWY